MLFYFKSTRTPLFFNESPFTRKMLVKFVICWRYRRLHLLNGGNTGIFGRFSIITYKHIR
jgi:hypothetical protein